MTLALILVDLADRHKIELSYESSKMVAHEGPMGNFKMTPVSLGLILGGGLIASLITGSMLMDNIRTNDNVMIIAHRGASGAAPENTLASIRQAIKDGADWIEIDVQETADGEVVVFHDGDFMRQSNVNLKIWDATVTDIAEIDIGSWFDAKFSSERTPTLRAVLDEARDKAKVLIELKYYGHDKKLEERVVQIVENAKMTPEIAVMSLKYDGVRKLRALRPNWEAGVLIAKSLGSPTKLDAEFLAVHVNMATGAFIRSTHQADKQLMVWTVNDAISMSRLISLGVDGVITDEPALARRVLAEREDMNAAERLLLHVVALFDLPTPRSQSGDDSP
jgi:glycerophosphoryl diester phosphodiesterase